MADEAVAADCNALTVREDTWQLERIDKMGAPAGSRTKAPLWSGTVIALKTASEPYARAAIDVVAQRTRRKASAKGDIASNANGAPRVFATNVDPVIFAV